MSYQSVIKHALTDYYDGNAELVEKLMARRDAEILREAAGLVDDAACEADRCAEPEFIAGLRTAIEVLNLTADSRDARKDGNS